tara:strand:- start:718 stop:1011 length:294 start_codon:yes stop_codon:yes gene_type:complete
MQSCPSCDIELPDDLKFCTDCGTPLETWEGLKHCSECETENSGLAEFCTNCGIPLPKKKSTAAEVGEGLAWIAVGVAVLLGIIFLWVFIVLITSDLS